MPNASEMSSMKSAGDEEWQQWRWRTQWRRAMRLKPHSDSHTRCLSITNLHHT